MSNFVTDLTTLPTGKTDETPIPAGEDPSHWVTAAEWEIAMQALYDLRGAIATSGGPASELGDGSDGALHFDGISSIAGFTLVGSVYTATRPCYPSSAIIDVGVTTLMPGFPFLCQGTCTNNGKLSWSGLSATTSTGAAAYAAAVLPGNSQGGGGATGSAGQDGQFTPRTYAGTGGAAGTFPSGAGGAGTGLGSGGGGGASAGASAGAGGKAGNAVANGADACTARDAILGATSTGGGLVFFGTTRTGGGGGGGAPDGTGGNGGGGGASGCYGVAGAKLWAGTGSIESKGGAGAGAQHANASGGGGGGGGRLNVLRGEASPVPTTAVDGGAGGAGSGTGAAGHAGNFGEVRHYVVGP